MTDLHFGKELLYIAGNSLNRVVCTATDTSYFSTKYNRFVTCFVFGDKLVVRHALISDRYVRSV